MMLRRDRFKAQDQEPEQVSEEGAADVTGESVVVNNDGHKNLPKLVTLLQLPLEGLPEVSGFKLHPNHVVRVPNSK